MMVGLKSRGTVFRVQRAINEYRAEPLLAILPGVALQQLWDLVGVAEKALLAVSTERAIWPRFTKPPTRCA